MPTCKKKKTESRVRRTRRTRLTRRVRRTRKRKGGNPCEKGIHEYDDNYQCVQAGCDEFKCAEIYHASKPHKDPEDAYNAKLEAERDDTLRRIEEREKRHKNRKNLKGPLSSVIAAQKQSSQERLSELMDELSIGANANHNATNPTNKTRTTIQGWPVQKEWGEGLPNIYGSR
jgi:hypothetical protein